MPKYRKPTNVKEENRWHTVFYALQREGFIPSRAAAVATTRLGYSHSDKGRTPAMHRRSYEHIFKKLGVSQTKNSHSKRILSLGVKKKR